MKVRLALLFVAVALLSAAAAAIVATTVAQREHEEVMSSLMSENEQLITDLAGQEADLGSKISTLEGHKARLESELADLQTKAAALEKQIEDQRVDYSSKANELREQIAELKDGISYIESEIARYESLHAVDVRAQAKLVDELNTYIKTMSPFVRMVDGSAGKSDKTTYKWVAVADLIAEEKQKAIDSGEDVFYTPDQLKEKNMSDEDYEAYLTELFRARVLAREDVFYPNVGVSYKDIHNGYSYNFESEKLFDAASVVKAPYILSLLQKVSSDEADFFEKLEDEEIEPEMVDTDDDDVPDTVVIEYSDPIYDLTKTVIYTKEEYFEDGSGKIKDMEDGTEFSYLDFVRYTLLYSDNVAYQALRDRYGHQLFHSLARKVKANSVLKSGNLMSAADAVKLFDAIYEFVQEDEKYGTVMKEAMSKANHTVIVPYGVYPTTTLHKYGWDKDAYHDVGIVMYKERPFILAVFSDLDNGGAEVNEYLCNIVRMIYKLHKEFYK